MKTNRIDKSASNACAWLVQSTAPTGGHGSCASFHIWKGWSPPYPETTGYIIDTLFDCQQITGASTYKTAAINLTDWLCSLQNADGSFPGGVGGALKPILFDTGMIAFGLLRAWKETGNECYLEPSRKALTWLAKQMEVNEKWGDCHYVPGYLPAYYTMVAWSMLSANRVLKITGLDERLRKELDSFCQLIQPNKSIKNWGFRQEEAAYTHTIGYTLQGMLEAGLLLNDRLAVQKAREVSEKLLETRRSAGRIAGTYDYNWKGDYSFECPTGNAQLSIVFFRLYELTGEPAFLDEARWLLCRVVASQSKLKIKGHFGGIPGSWPIWGKYQRFAYPNWAAKFFIDACILAKKHG